MARDDYDSPWKEALAKYLPRFFEFFFAEIFQDVDWQKMPRFLDKELQAVAPTAKGHDKPDPKGGPRVVDTLVQLQRKSGQQAWVMVHIEVQSQRVQAFEERLYLYHARIFERYRKPVCSLVVLADRSQNWRPTQYQHALWGNELLFRFPNCKLLDFQSQLPILETSQNPFGLLTASTLHAQATKQDATERHAAKTRMVRGLYQAGLGKQEVRDFFRLTDWILRLSPPLEKRFKDELRQMEEEMGMPYITSIERLGRAEGLEQGLERGLEQGLEQGRAEGLKALRDVVSDILETRFQGVSAVIQERLAKVSALDQLRALGRLAATAESLEEFQRGFEGPNVDKL